MFDFLEKALSEKKAEAETYLEIRYFRLTDDLKPYKRGTVIFEDGRVIPSYPKIGRLFVISEGLKRFYKEPFFIEEKADGYNVRITQFDNKIIALTRGGFICPFTTDRLKDFFNFESFFKNYPNLILCGEVVGPNNPYMELSPPYILEDVAFRLFDIYDISQNRFLFPHERYKIADDFNIPHVERYGLYTSEDVKKINELILSLNQRGIEGVVFKSAEKPQKYFKYATPSINIKDIEADIDLIFELPADFFIQRIYRYAISSVELDYKNDEEVERLGKILISKLVEYLNFFKRNGKVSRTYTIYFNNEENALEFVKLENRASRVIKVRVISLTKVNNKYQLTIEKTFLKATSKLQRLFKGYPLYD